MISPQTAEDLLKLGHSFRLKKQNQKALNYFEEAAKLFESKKDYENLAYVYRDMSEIYLGREKLGQALAFAAKAELYFKLARSYEAHSISQITMGSIYLRAGQLQTGRKHITSGIKNARKAKSWFSEMLAFFHLGEQVFLHKQYNDMLPYMWAAYGVIVENDALEEQKVKLAEIYGFLAWGYCMTDSIEYAKKFFAKSQEILLKESEDIQSEIQKHLQLEKLKKKLQS